MRAADRRHTLVLLASILLLSAPQFVLAGSQAFYSSGAFTVPYYSSLTAVVNGAGGGGGGTGDGAAGGASSFDGSVYAAGGGGGQHGAHRVNGGNDDASNNGAGGGASGGDTNTTGGGAAGGQGGHVQLAINSTEGGNGGNGGQAVKTYGAGALAPGSSISVVVGAGGAGGGNGSPGGNGSVSITWDGAAPPPPPPPQVLSCSISFDKNPIRKGGSAAIVWSSAKANLFYINGIGYVGGSGSARVSPGSTSDFGGYVSDASGATVSCPATLTVSNSCPPGQVLINGKCTQSCPPGFTYRDGQCVFVGCPLGYVRQGDRCVFSACPAGYYKDGDQCVRATQCTTPPKCVGDDLINSCTGALIRSCDWGCTSGACNAVPAPSATLKATPALVRSGVITTVSWTGTNVTSCTVHGTNGDSWTGKASDGRTSSPINGQTIYTLHCIGYSGAQPPSIDKSVTVNLVPSFNEQ